MEQTTMTWTHHDEQDRQRAKAESYGSDDGKAETMRLLPHFKAIASVTGLAPVYLSFDTYTDECADFDQRHILNAWPEMADFAHKWHERMAATSAKARAERIAADYALSQIECEPLPRFLSRPPYAEPESRAELAWGDAFKLGALVVICTGIVLFMIKAFAS